MEFLVVSSLLNAQKKILFLIEWVLGFFGEIIFSKGCISKSRYHTTFTLHLTSIYIDLLLMVIWLLIIVVKNTF